jgi:hypothetical protein
MAFAEAWQEAETIAETLNDALAVAASAGFSVKPDARIPKANTGNAALFDIALPLTRKN